jgi:hypothetical protein
LDEKTRDQCGQQENDEKGREKIRNQNVCVANGTSDDKLYEKKKHEQGAEKLGDSQKCPDRKQDKKDYNIGNDRCCDKRNFNAPFRPNIHSSRGDFIYSAF